MRGFLMMGVVGFVRDRPRGGEAADDEDTDHQHGRERLSCSAVTHVVPINHRPPSACTLREFKAQSQGRVGLQPCVFL